MQIRGTITISRARLTPNSAGHGVPFRRTHLQQKRKHETLIGEGTLKQPRSSNVCEKHIFSKRVIYETEEDKRKAKSYDEGKRVSALECSQSARTERGGTRGSLTRRQEECALFKFSSFSYPESATDSGGPRGKQPKRLRALSPTLFDPSPPSCKS